MTALTEYQRLESPGLWRAAPDEQRVDVIVALGEATLTLTDLHERALAHWSLPAIQRLNPGERPALFSPGPDSGEELELDDEAMIAAIEKVHRVIVRRGPHHGRLRQVLTGSFIAAVAALAVFWLPDALVRYTVTVVPAPVRATVGQHLLTRIQRISGQRCSERLGSAALSRLGARVLGPGRAELAVLPGLAPRALILPGRIILLDRSLIEAFDDPAAAAGFILAEDERARRVDPMQALLHRAGFIATLRLLTTGALPEATLDTYAEGLVMNDPQPVDPAALLSRFAEADLRATPYAYARDPSGETTLALIEADPFAEGAGRMLLSDGDWISLQGICGE